MGHPAHYEEDGQSQHERRGAGRPGGRRSGYRLSQGEQVTEVPCSRSFAPATGVGVAEADAGGLWRAGLYISMFCRQFLGGLTAVWSFIQDFNLTDMRLRRIPPTGKLEVARLLALTPLARMDFRAGFDGQVTCSDASTTLGCICVSTQVSRMGAVAAGGKLRG